MLHTYLGYVDISHCEMNHDELGGDFQSHVGDDQGIVVHARPVQDVCQREQGDVLHLSGRVLEGVAQAGHRLVGVTLDAPVERRGSAQNPGGGVL